MNSFKVLLGVLLFACIASAQSSNNGILGQNISSSLLTITKLPSAASSSGQTFLVGDSSDGTCGSGSGSKIIACTSNGTTWTASAIGGSAGGAVALTDAATITTNASLGSHFRVTLGGNRTLAAPTNPTDGQKVTWELIQDGTGSRTITLDPSFHFGTDVTGVTLTTTAGKRDFLGAIYNSTTGFWYVLSFAKGY